MAVRILWKVITAVPHPGLEAALQDLTDDGWTVNQLLDATRNADEPTLTLVAFSQEARPRLRRAAHRRRP